MIPFAKIAGGMPSSVAGLTDHLQNQTLTPQQEWLANYYNRGAGNAEELEVRCLAEMVVDGTVSHDMALDILQRRTSVGTRRPSQPCPHRSLAGRH